MNMTGGLLRIHLVMTQEAVINLKQTSSTEHVKCKNLKTVLNVGLLYICTVTYHCGIHLLIYCDFFICQIRCDTRFMDASSCTN